MSRPIPVFKEGDEILYTCPGCSAIHKGHIGRETIWDKFAEHYLYDTILYEPTDPPVPTCGSCHRKLVLEAFYMTDKHISPNEDGQ